MTATKFTSLLPLLAVTLYALPTISASGTPSWFGQHCPPLPRGDIIASAYQLYPENADWDPVLCRVWLGAVWNATVVRYNPYANAVEAVLEFPGISHTGALHIGGVAWDPYYYNKAKGKKEGKEEEEGKSRHVISILANSARPWATEGRDVTGERGLIKYDVSGGEVLWEVNVTDVSRDLYGGFQDIEHDRWGRTYIVGTWPGTILRVERDGRGLREWLVPDPLPETPQKGYSGLAVVRETGGDTMLAVDGDGRLYRFDLAEEQDRGTPVNVPIRPEVLYNDTDAIYLPPMYGGRVLLVASLFSGIQVLRSKDRSWKTAEYLGTIPIPTGQLYERANVVVASVQMGSSSVYMVLGWNDPLVPGIVPGNRMQFPFPDITDRIEDLLSK
ncbi:uncharacterized protein B0T15DRAFT_520288 [Chaetomium strumarium]|uniref:Uncharacterized protein n=1 Tax=Chaetomium strumarium TaxID=1170767 RepID=A0AAJ0H3D0_9PEZI|nr:hypothetical protein B0T15DRAFT_520288 [Chaetomium strumarium]